MNIALPILLLVFGGLTFWVLAESSLRWYVKSLCITVFCIFTIVFWASIRTFLGWAADGERMPEKVRVHWVVIKEPNKQKEFLGAIYVLIESAEKEKNPILRFFGYRSERLEPRLYELEYSKNLHKQLQEGVMGKLKNGQPVLGQFKKQGGQKGKGKNNGKNEKGGGSHSQEQEFHFHELRPSDFNEKPSD